MQRSDEPVDFTGEAPTEVMYYGTSSPGWREEPIVVTIVPVVRSTAMQLIVKAPNGKEGRFYRKNGRLVGGGWRSEQVKPVTEATKLDMRESGSRRRVYRAVEAIRDAGRKIDHTKIGRLSVDEVNNLEPFLVEIHAKLQGVLEALGIEGR